MGVAIAGLRFAWLVCCLLSIAVDARQRRFPNGLFAVMAVVSASLVLFDAGALTLFRHVLAALIVCGILTALECFWRRRKGTVGMGMGDIKALFCLVLMDPAIGLLSFCLGMMLLALVGVLARKGALPALPFICTAFIVLRLLAAL